MTAVGDCIEQAIGCGNCCRHQHEEMEIDVCISGNVYELCPPQNYYYNTQVWYCPGEEPNVCTYAGDVACGHYAVGGVGITPCDSPN